LYRSADHGRTWRALGAIPVVGTATSLALSPAGALVLATTAGLYYSPDGHAWRAARLDVPAPGGGGFGFVGMTTSSNGVAVPSGRGSRELYITTDGGQNWRHSPIR
jgi:BNR/Asp-box repeat protein